MQTMQFLFLAAQLSAVAALLRGPVVGQVSNLSTTNERSERSLKISGWGIHVAKDRIDANRSEVVARSSEAMANASVENMTNSMTNASVENATIARRSNVSVDNSSIVKRTNGSMDNSSANSSKVLAHSSRSVANRSVENVTVVERSNSSVEDDNQTSSKVVKKDASAGFSPGPFQKYYQSWEHGRGLWKWNVALAVYDRHLTPFVNREARLLEVGVQSGGSILMYHKVLPRAYYFGLDVNQKCSNFTDARSSIFVGDQGSVDTWSHFWDVAGPVDILLDDGGHHAEGMLATLKHGLPRVNPGGVYFAEGIHAANQDYLKLFFYPMADSVDAWWSGTEAKIYAVHIYPFMLGVELGPGGDHWMPPNVSVPTYEGYKPLMDSFPSHRGKVVRLYNKDWGSSLGSDSLKNFFNAFHDLHGGQMTEVPEGCHAEFSAKCTMIVGNTELQDMVRGVHIYEREAFVELHEDPPLIYATRMGDKWIPVGA